MRDLGTIGGTAVYLVNGLNNRGQIVGGMNVAGDQSFHPFLWDGSALRDLGTFGGDWGSADSINEFGDVVGWTLMAGNQASHAFLWRKGVLTDLGTVNGDPSSTAFVVNSERQVVGATQDDNFAYVHAFLWEKGSITDLNTLIPADSGVQLMAAVGLNERGEIVAQGVLSDGDLHAFLLIPCDENHAGVEGCDYSLVDADAAIENPASLRQEPATSAPHNHPFGRRGLSHRYFGTQSGTLQIGENTSTLQMESSDDADSLLGTITRAPPLLREDLGTLSGTRVAGRCVRGGGQCPPWTKCCPGLKCVPASTRAFCE